MPTQQQIVQIQVPPTDLGMPVQVRIPDGRIVSVPIPHAVDAGQIINVAVPAPAPTSVSSEAIPVAEAYEAERVSGAPLGEEQCVICQDAIRGAHERLPCSHVFHRACLERWLRDREHRFCPRKNPKSNNGTSGTRTRTIKSMQPNDPHAGGQRAREDIGRGVAGSRARRHARRPARRPTRTSAPTMRRTCAEAVALECTTTDPTRPKRQVPCSNSSTTGADGAPWCRSLYRRQRTL